LEDVLEENMNRRKLNNIRTQIQKDFNTIQSYKGWFYNLSTSNPWAISKTKRALDFVLSFLGLIALCPIFLVIFLIIKFDSKGSVLYVQERTGFLGRRFKMYKFRTMVNGAEEMKNKYSHLNCHDSNTPDFKIPKDPRITKIGKFLRKHSLDELPNLINVLNGDLSLVGPRPTSFDITTYGKKHYIRLCVPPGVTGLWQIMGRSDINFTRRVAIDRFYIRNQSPWLDIKIIFITILRVVDGKGAY